MNVGKLFLSRAKVNVDKGYLKHSSPLPQSLT
jgi:hypothetical protein